MVRDGLLRAEFTLLNPFTQLEFAFAKWMLQRKPSNMLRDMSEEIFARMTEDTRALMQQMQEHAVSPPPDADPIQLY